MHDNDLSVRDRVQKRISNTSLVSLRQKAYSYFAVSTQTFKSTEHQMHINSHLAWNKSSQRMSASSTYLSTRRQTYSATEMTFTPSSLLLRRYSHSTIRAEQRSRFNSRMEHLQRTKMAHSDLSLSRRNFYITRPSSSWTTFSARITQRLIWLMNHNASASSASPSWRTLSFYHVDIFACVKAAVKSSECRTTRARFVEHASLHSCISNSRKMSSSHLLDR